MPLGAGANDAQGVYLVGESDATGPLFSDFINLGPASISTQLAKRARYFYRWADATARGAQAGMRINDRGYQIDTDTNYRYSGSAWQVDSGKSIFKRAANQSLATSTTVYSLVALDTVQLSLGAFTRSAGPSPAAGTLTNVIAGDYEIRASGIFAANATGARVIRIEKNGAPVISNGTTPGTSLGAGVVQVSEVVTFTAGDTLTITALQSSGGALNMTATVVIERAN